MEKPNWEQGPASEENAQKLSFQQSLKLLPPVLLNEVITRFGAAALMGFGTIVMLCVSKERSWAGCILIALFPLYSAMDIVWSFASNKLLVARVVICKSRKNRRGQIDMIVRDASVTDLTAEEVETCRIRINAKRYDRGLITSGTILDIYIKEGSPNLALAYKIIG